MSIKKRAKKLDANELLLISVRINELSLIKSRLSNDLYLIKSTCREHYHTSSLNAKSSISILISEIELEKKRLTKRSKVLITRLIKRSGKQFEESPSKIVPLHSRDILNGYIELIEISNDQPVPHLLLLDSGEVETADSVRAKEVLSKGPTYTNDYTNKKISAHAILARVWPG